MLGGQPNGSAEAPLVEDSAKGHPKQLGVHEGYHLGSTVVDVFSCPDSEVHADPYEVHGSSEAIAARASGKE